MNPRDWCAFTVMLEATFRGGLTADQELALQRYVGRMSLDTATQVVDRLVDDGQVFMPTPAECLRALTGICGGRGWTFDCLLAGETSDARHSRLQAMAAEHFELARGGDDG